MNKLAVSLILATVLMAGIFALMPVLGLVTPDGIATGNPLTNTGTPGSFVNVDGDEDYNEGSDSGEYDDYHDGEHEYPPDDADNN